MSWEGVLKRDVDVRARELIESTKRDPLMRELKRLQKEFGYYADLLFLFCKSLKVSPSQQTAFFLKLT